MSRKKQALIKQNTGFEEESEHTSGRLNNAKGSGALPTDPFFMLIPTPEA